LFIKTADRENSDHGDQDRQEQDPPGGGEPRPADSICEIETGKIRHPAQCPGHEAEDKTHAGKQRHPRP
jgi:hypothetical protein